MSIISDDVTGMYIFPMLHIFFHRVDAVVDPWLTSLWQNILELYPLAPGKVVIPDTVQCVFHSSAIISFVLLMVV